MPKLFGMKIEKTRDSANRNGLYFFFWYRKSLKRIGHASLWIPYSRGNNA